MSEEEVPLMRGGNGVKMDFDGRSISFSSDEPNFFIARITAQGGCSGTPAYIYAWEEMVPAGNGITYQVKPNGRSGSLTKYPAFELNNTAVPNSKIVFMRERSYASGAFTCPTYTGADLNTPVYDFIYGGGGGPENCPRVSNVTCTANMLVVTYQLACEETTAPELQGNCPVGAPVGSILMWTQEPIPTGWLECNGSTFNAVDYPELFDLYGNNILPDLRSAFIRGRGPAAGTLNAFGTIYPYKTGAPVTPFTVSTAPDHTHPTAPGSAINTGGGGTTLSGYTNSGTTGAGGSHTHTITGGDTETVPAHKVLIYIVKAAT